MNTYPVFRKDFRILCGIVVKAFILQGILFLLIPGLDMFWREHFHSALNTAPMSDWFPKYQIAMNIIMALIAAAYWSTEERAEKNDLFLRRLPESVRRIWTEKTAAAIVVLAGTLLIQWLWYVISSFFGIVIWNKDDQVLLYLSNVTFLAYLIGLPLSCWLSQSVAVILCGCTIMYPGMWIFSMWENKGLANLWWIFLIWLAFVLPFVAIILFSRIRGQRRLIARTKIEALVFKQLRENKAIYLLVGLMMLLSIVFNIILIGWSNNIDHTSRLYDPMNSLNGFNIIYVYAWGIFLPIILGITTYTTLEKDGLRCVLYHHPIRLSTIYWTKFITGLIPTFFLMLVFAIAVSWSMPNIPTNDYLKPMGLVFMFLGGIILYCCGVLVTQGVVRPLYAIFATLPFGLIIGGGFSYLSFQELKVNQVFAMLDNGNPTPKSIMLSGNLLWFCLLIFIGLSLAGWRAATDRQVLSGAPGYRLIYVSRLVIFVLVASIFLIRTGWKDLFFLVTGIDIGMG